MNPYTDLARKLGHALCDQLEAMSELANTAYSPEAALEIVSDQVELLCALAAGALRARGELHLAERFEQVAR